MEIKKLDNYFKNYRINDCLLKIDVEGFELEVLHEILNLNKKGTKGNFERLNFDLKFRTMCEEFF